MSPIDAAADAWVRALMAGWAVGIVVGRLSLWPERQESNLRHVG